ncbi:MAG: hypothetical protein K2Y10_00085 [Burkholderiaceae bacterium]|nr:hypothetical protein [Burkholderiaceae bacterium]
MASVSAVSSVTQQSQAPAVRATKADSDADQDGSKVETKDRTPAQPQVSKPTATMGNNVNVMA